MTPREQEGYLPEGEREPAEPEFLVRILTCRQVQDGPASSGPVHETIDIRSERLWTLLRKNGAYVIGACIG